MENTSELAFKCDKFKVYKVKKLSSSGKPYVDWNIVYNDSVVILALTKENQAVLIREHVGESNKPVLQLPGGGSKENEGLEAAAKRELAEETGFTGDAPVLLFKNSESTRKLEHDVYYFAVSNAKKSTVQKFDSDEMITDVVLIDFKELLSLSKNNRLETSGDAEAVLALAKRMTFSHP